MMRSTASSTSSDSTDRPADRMWAMYLCVFLVGAALLFLGGRVAWINVALSGELEARAARQLESASVLPARRGMILDRRGRVLAVSRQRPDVFVDCSLAKDLSELAAALGPRINRDADELAAHLEARRNSRYVVLARAVDEVTEGAVIGLDHPAVGVAQNEVRSYPHGKLLSHVMGIVSRDGRGIEGVELSFDRHLRGTPGRTGALRDARRRTLAWSDSGFVPPIDGGHVSLTIDAELQRLTEKNLAEGIDDFDAASGVAIVLDVASAEVLAMATYPTFDPNAPSESPPANRRNRALTDPVEPGSTFKPFIASGALAGGVIDTVQKFDCANGVKFFGPRRVQDTKPSGMLDLKGIITRSSNIGMAQIALLSGNELLHKTMVGFGFGSRTGVELPGEDSGLVYPLSKWNKLYSPTSVCQGYEVTATPLQLAAGMNALVSGGVWRQPTILRSLTTAAGERARSFRDPPAARQVIAPEAADYIARVCLRSVVENGSSKVVELDGYRVLGKTGTAKLTYKDRRGYEPGAYQSMFIGAAPAESPEIVTLVMIRRPDPQKGYYGATVAAPTAGRIFRDALGYMGIPPAGGATLAADSLAGR